MGCHVHDLAKIIQIDKIDALKTIFNKVISTMCTKHLHNDKQ